MIITLSDDRYESLKLITRIESKQVTIRQDTKIMIMCKQ